MQLGFGLTGRIEEMFEREQIDIDSRGDEVRPIRDRTAQPPNSFAMVVVAIILCALAATETWVQAYQADQAVRGYALEGTVAAVEATTGMIRVSRGPFGLLATSLEVTPATQVRVVGRPATLADIRDSARIRVGYTVRDGRRVATRIDLVLPPTVTAGTGS